MYYIDIKAEALLFLDRLKDKITEQMIKTEIRKLSEHPKTKGKTLKKNNLSRASYI